MHIHPILQVPICSVCIEDCFEYRPLALQEEDDDYCEACLQHEDEPLFLCDNIVQGNEFSKPCPCELAFCATCVAQAHGGGRSGIQKAQQLAVDDGPWKCLSCQPPAALQRLQATVQGATPDFNNNSNSPTPQRTAEDVLKELDAVEAEKQRCRQEFDDSYKIEEKRREIEHEFRQQKPNLSRKKLEALVNEEMEVYTEQCTKHHRRLEDFVTSLQEELETLHHLDLAEVYKKVFREEPTKSNPDLEPEWKRAADAEIDKRKKEEPPATITPILDPECYRSEIFDGMEDLGTVPEDERECPGQGFRSTQDRPSVQDIEAAMRAEDEVLQEKRIRCKKRFNENLDQQEMVEEEKQTSRTGKNGVSRVRRDTLVTVLAARRKTPKKRRQSQQKSPFKLAPQHPTAVAAGAPQAAKKLKQPPDVVDLVDLTSDNPPPPPPQTQRFRPIPAGTIKKETQNRQAGPKSDRSAVDDYYSPRDLEWADSDLVLSSPDTYKSSSGRVKTVTVSKELEAVLKPHQKEAVQFFWNNAFVDLSVRSSKDQELREDKDVGGCILAHSMGLGKSLSTIALIHTVRNHPSLVDPKTQDSLIKTILLVVPVNTIASWESEFRKWARSHILVYNMQENSTDARPYVVDQWIERGGVLLISKDSFQKCAKTMPKLQSGPDVVVIDEAHLSLSNRNNAVYKALDAVQTRRRLLLTGSPFQNNMMEYYRMVKYIRPIILDESEANFQMEFAIPIMRGMPSDAPPAAKIECQLKCTQLNKILAKHVNRRDATTLREDLPPMQQVVLHIRQSKLQTLLYRTLRRYEKQEDITNYLTRYQLAKPIHNHPACVLATKSDDALGSKSDKEQLKKASSKKWWQKVVDRIGLDALKAAKEGPKIVLLLHILAHAVSIGDKVVVFSESLGTLDFIEEVLQLECWADHIPSLAKEFPELKHLGGWKKGETYLRIDGSNNSGERGTMVSKFNEVERTPEERIQLFLISSKAGGIGITLCAANRVVLFDSHFNPTVTTQCVFRCYRYGQEKPVFAYRFLTEGTAEEKIYSRSVNKTGLSLQVIDGKQFESVFSEQELSNLAVNDTWVQCEDCEQWRMLPPGDDEEDLPEKWHCHMNKDEANNTCDAPERNKVWYHKHFGLSLVDTGSAQNSAVSTPARSIEAGALKDKRNELEAVRNDEILMRLVGTEEKRKASAIQKSPRKGKKRPDDPCDIISKYYFHEALLETSKDADDGGTLVFGSPKKLSAKSPVSVTGRQCAKPLPASLTAPADNGIESGPMQSRRQAQAGQFLTASNPRQLQPAPPSVAPRKKASQSPHKATQELRQAKSEPDDGTNVAGGGSKRQHNGSPGEIESVSSAPKRQRNYAQGEGQAAAPLTWTRCALNETGKSADDSIEILSSDEEE